MTGRTEDTAAPPMGMGARLDRAVGAVSYSLTTLGSTVIASFMLLICADVLLRKFFSLPLNGVSEFVAYAIVACVFCQLGATMRAGKMIHADFLMGGWERDKPVLAHGAMALYAAIALALLALMVQWLADDAADAWRTDEFAGAVGAFQMPLWPFKLATAIGALVATAEALILLCRHGAKFLRALAVPGPGRGLVGLVILVVLMAAFLLLIAYGDLSRMQLGFLAFLGLFAMVACGMPVAFALIGMSFVAIWAIRSNVDVSLNALGISASGAVRSFEFGVVPLFVMMGLVLDRADVGRDAFRVAVVLLRGVRGGLANATVGANAIFAAITGSSIASAAVFSRIAVPPMVEAGYTRRFAVGVVAGSSVLGMLIPPSLLLIIYGLVAETSIGALFVAAIVPGILLAVAFGLMNATMATFAKGFVGNAKPDATDERMSFGEMLANLAPVIFLIVLVMGGIYGGLVSPTEAGALGALGALVVAAARGRLTWPTLKDVVLEAGFVTAGILFLIIAASFYSRMIALSSIPMVMTQFIAGQDLTLIAFCLTYVALVMLLGMILDSVSIILIVSPIALPIIAALGGDPIWFGVLTIIAVEIGLLTPPFGLSVFVVKGSLPDGYVTLGEIFSGVTPFVVTMVLFTVLMVFVPGIALVLL
ncbi:TRAP transporter large permease subunit [Amorphus coralli]|uniref:TRAP transporter large permease subunit n=1 Tax=Amorphus coralli TaxID=340680 RepID=UPI00040CA9F4|nr:TRAP transporter large permease subunit [Amorphus coralli]